MTSCIHPYCLKEYGHDGEHTLPEKTESAPELIEYNFMRKTERITDWTHKILINGNIVTDNESRILINQILQGQRLIQLIKHYEKYPIAMNYATFESWVKKLLQISTSEIKTKDLIT